MQKIVGRGNQQNTKALLFTQRRLKTNASEEPEYYLVAFLHIFFVQLFDKALDSHAHHKQGRRIQRILNTACICLFESQAL